MDLFWDDVPALVGRQIRTVRYTTLGTRLGESLVVVACTDGTLVRLKCTDLGCEVAEILEASGEEEEEP
jgi:hypothetical protein